MSISWRVFARIHDGHYDSGVDTNVVDIEVPVQECRFDHDINALRE
jgi:hypothetical protein